MFRWTKYLVERSHAGHVDPVDVDVDTGPPQQGHDRHPVALLDALLEDHLVGEANPALARILPSKNTCSARHGSCLCCPVVGTYGRLWILKCLSFRLSQWLHDHLIAFFTICVRRPATEVCGSLSNLCSTGRWVGVGFERALGVVEGPES